ncbi:hypothetical protein [Rummeliibacillus stabekisii]|uniref:hypothetical protein n=1 Tax=Rummeliibacillus stabekisii TaxID=241244 RepID=UPI00371AA73B
MARFRMNVNFRNTTKGIETNINNKMKEAITDVTLDLQRVASQSAPHDSGFLEGNSQYHVNAMGKTLEGTVSFSASNKGFDYAQWANDKQYNLGEKSARKSGGKSRFGGGTVPVGTGYLKNALEMNKAGYIRHLQDKYREALNR